MRTAYDAARSLRRYVAQALGPEWEVRLPGDDAAFSRPFCRIQLPDSGELANGTARIVDMRRRANLICFPEESETADAAFAETLRVEELLFQALRVGVGTLFAPTGLAGVSQAGGTLAAGTYRYVVTALNRKGQTTVSEFAEVAVAANRKVALTWDPAGATAYRVYRGGEGQEKLLAHVPAVTGVAPAYTDTGVRAPYAHIDPPEENTARVAGPLRIPIYDYEGLAPYDAAGEDRRIASDYLVLDGNPTVGHHRDPPSDPMMYVVTADIRMSWRRWGALLSSGPVVESVTAEPIPGGP